MKFLSVILCITAVLTSSCKEKNTTIETSDVKEVVETTEQETILVIDAARFLDDINTRSEIQLVDVRTPAEYEVAHLKGAVNYSVTETTFQENVAQLDMNKPIYVYCKSGGRSARASEQLKQYGFKEIRDLQGGITAWQAANLPTEN